MSSVDMTWATWRTRRIWLGRVWEWRVFFRHCLTSDVCRLMQLIAATVAAVSQTTLVHRPRRMSPSRQWAPVAQTSPVSLLEVLQPPSSPAMRRPECETARLAVVPVKTRPPKSRTANKTKNKARYVAQFTKPGCSPLPPSDKDLPSTGTPLAAVISLFRR